MAKTKGKTDAAATPLVPGPGERVIVLLDHDRAVETERIVKAGDVAPSMTIDGVVYQHCDERADGAWRFYPAQAR